MGSSIGGGSANQSKENTKPDNIQSVDGDGTKMPNILSTNTTQSKVVTGGKNHFILNKTQKILMVSLILLLAVISAISFINYSNEQKKQQKESLIQQADLGMRQGNYSESEAKFDDAISKAGSKQEKADLYLQKAGACFVSKNNSSCIIDSLNKHDELVGENYKSLILRGFILKQESKYDESKIYLEKALNQLNGLQNPTEEETQQKAYVQGLLEGINRAE